MKKTLQYPCKGFLLVLFISFFVMEAYSQSSTVDMGKSFTNITRLTTGGTFNPNDIIEINVTIAVRNVAPSQITAVQVYDTVPAKTTYIPNSIRITTTEDITYKGPFTDANDSDQGRNVGGNILINLGSGATGTTGGTIKNTDRPSFFGTSCIMVACYRVRINAAANYGDTISIGGKVTYSISGSPRTVNFTKYQIILSQLNISPCTNGTNVSAAGDSLGTFASGTATNRATSLAFATTYTKVNVGTGAPQDYYYSIVKNSSPDSWTNPNSTMPEGTALHRVFGFWDIGGDHTGASNQTFGNPPPAAGTRAGYMVLINASYKTDTAYRETLTNLCPDTYYEFSAWFRNVCPRCSCDSVGRASGAAGYIPGPGNDSSGVKPNITFEIDGLAYYTSGEIKYDRTAPWKKYGFTFRTKPGQTTAIFQIRNNSPGGGGNDWALDDISISHCGPTLAMNHNPYVLGCSSAPFVVSLSDTVRYIYSNSYVHYKWQRSNVGGTVWTDLTGPGTSGVGIPTLVGGQYQYVTNLPPFLATAADSGRYYRVLVGTSAANLTGNCSYTDGHTTMLRVINCGIVLSTNLTQFNGQLIEKKASLYWTATNEKDLSMYEIEKSNDGANFYKSGTVKAKNMNDVYYNYTDPVNVTGIVYYRLKMIDANGLFKYSPVIVLSSELDFEISNINNPFSNTIKADVSVPKDGRLNVILFNENGQLVKNLRIKAHKGLNKITVDNIEAANGIYFLSVDFENGAIKRKLLKINQ